MPPVGRSLLFRYILVWPCKFLSTANASQPSLPAISNALNNERPPQKPSVKRSYSNIKDNIKDIKSKFTQFQL